MGIKKSLADYKINTTTLETCNYFPITGNYFFVSDDSTVSDFGSLGWADWQVSGLNGLEKKYHVKIGDDEKIVDIAEKFHDLTPG